MTHILHIDASARPGIAGTGNHGSHSRHLTYQLSASGNQAGRKTRLPIAI